MPKIWLTCLFLSAASLVVSQASAQAIPEMDVLMEEGDWELRSQKDAFTDEIGCVIVKKDDYTVQLTQDALYVSMRGKGGVKGFQYRIDEEEPGPHIIPDDNKYLMFNRDGEGLFPKQEGALDRILNGKRLRIQVLTVLETLENLDFNLTGISAVYARMSEDCKKID